MPFFLPNLIIVKKCELEEKHNIVKNRGWNYRITAQQTEVHLRLSLDSVHGSYCPNIEQGGLT
jgi:CRISPR/Cas system-associated exonuclease Cas4 (RecB family)